MLIREANLRRFWSKRKRGQRLPKANKKAAFLGIVVQHLRHQFALLRCLARNKALPSRESNVASSALLTRVEKRVYQYGGVFRHFMAGEHAKK